MERPENCPRCEHSKIIRNGFVNEVQRWQCKACRFSFTRLTPRGKPKALKLFAILLYGMGLSFNATGKLFAVSGEAVSNCVNDFEALVPTAPLPAKAHVIEMDEMWHFCEKNRKNSGSGKPLIVIQGDF